MSVRIIDHTPSVKNGIVSSASLFLRLMADEIVSISTPNTPKKKGNLRRDVIRQVLGLHGKVRWDKNYAAKQETTQYRNYTTPGTGPHFAENAVGEGVKRTGEIARKAKLV